MAGASGNDCKGCELGQQKRRCKIQSKPKYEKTTYSQLQSPSGSGVASYKEEKTIAQIAAEYEVYPITPCAGEPVRKTAIKRPKKTTLPPYLRNRYCPSFTLRSSSWM